MGWVWKWLTCLSIQNDLKELNSSNAFSLSFWLWQILEFPDLSTSENSIQKNFIGQGRRIVRWVPHHGRLYWTKPGFQQPHSHMLSILILSQAKHSLSPGVRHFSSLSFSHTLALVLSFSCVLSLSHTFTLLPSGRFGVVFSGIVVCRDDLPPQSSQDGHIIPWVLWCQPGVEPDRVSCILVRARA